MQGVLLPDLILTVALLIEPGRKVHGDKRQQCDDGGGDKQLVYRQVALGDLRDIIAQSLSLGAGDELEVAVDDDLIHLFTERTADGVCKQRACDHREEHEEHDADALELTTVLLRVQALHPHGHRLHEDDIADADEDNADKARPVCGDIQRIFRVEAVGHVADDEEHEQAAEYAQRRCEECNKRHLFVVDDADKGDGDKHGDNERDA